MSDTFTSNFMNHTPLLKITRSAFSFNQAFMAAFICNLALCRETNITEALSRSVSSNHALLYIFTLLSYAFMGLSTLCVVRTVMIV